MKAKLEFEYNTDAADEVADIRVIEDARKWKGICWDLDSQLRSKLKYEPLTEPEAKAFQEIRDLLNQLIREDDLNLDG